jgi:DnaK suppressor protein
LLQLRAGAQRELDGATAVGADDSAREGDQADQASAAVDREFGIVNRKRTQALLNQIEQALVRLDNGAYGYCEKKKPSCIVNSEQISSLVGPKSG